MVPSLKAISGGRSDRGRTYFVLPLLGRTRTFRIITLMVLSIIVMGYGGMLVLEHMTSSSITDHSLLHFTRQLTIGLVCVSAGLITFANTLWHSFNMK